MVFNSFNFWIVFPILFILYWAIPSKWVSVKKAFLIVCSYLLYMNWKPSFALVLIGVTLVTYVGGLVLQQNKRRRIIGWTFAILTFLPLLVFKYYNFINDTLTQCLEAIGMNFSLPGLNWAVPVGISFFTFQAVGYLLDVYHNRIDAERNILDYILFVSFFPQVTSGPISKASELLPQIKNPRPFNYSQVRDGLKFLLWGMFLKVVLADRLGMAVDSIFDHYTHRTGGLCIAASIGYTLQIYCDFAGYSYMAMGIARTLGYNIVNNFEQPYLAISITDFWKRWHISLTRWLTQQIYIPLGGSRCSKVRMYLNIMFTFLVSGIWHGANWTFIIWGMLHGVYQIIEKALGLQKLKNDKWICKLARIALTFVLVNFAWIFFRMPTLQDSINVIGMMVTNPGGMDLVGTVGMRPLLILGICLPILIFRDFRKEFFPTRMRFLDAKVMRFAEYTIIFSLIITCGVLDGGQFIYVNF